MKLDEFIAARKEAWQHPIQRLWSSAYCITCPHCRADLLVDRYVLCSQHCEKCGQRVIDDDDLAPEEIAQFPTVGEYQEASRRHQLVRGWGIWIVIGSFFLSISIAGLYTNGAFGYPVEWMANFVMGWACLGSPLLGMVCLNVVLSRTGSSDLLRCQDCKQMNLALAHYVISTRRCPHCGQRHLCDDLDTEPKPVPLITACDALQQVRRCRMLILQWSCILGGLFLFVVAIVNTIPTANAPAFLQPPLGFLLILFGVLGIVLEVMIRLFGWRYPIRCPHCQKSCKYVGLVIATKHCNQCGQRVIAELVPPEMACANSV